MLEKQDRSESESPNPGAAPQGEPEAVAPAAEARPEKPGKPPKQEKEEKKDKKKGKQPVEGQAPEPPGPPPGPAPRPRLPDHYEQRVRPALAEQFGLGNRH